MANKYSCHHATDLLGTYGLHPKMGLIILNYFEQNNELFTRTLNLKHIFFKLFFPYDFQFTTIHWPYRSSCKIVSSDEWNKSKNNMLNLITVQNVWTNALLIMYHVCYEARVNDPWLLVDPAKKVYYYF